MARGVRCPACDHHRCGRGNRRQATIEDPETFSRPWKISLPLYKRIDKNVQLLEFKCVEFSEELLYGDLVKKTE